MGSFNSHEIVIYYTASDFMPRRTAGWMERVSPSRQTTAAAVSKWETTGRDRPHSGRTSAGRCHYQHPPSLLRRTVVDFPRCSPDVADSMTPRPTSARALLRC